MDNTDDDIEAMLEVEFPPEDNNEDIENLETEEAASERLEVEIEERYLTDENGLITVTVQKYKNTKHSDPTSHPYSLSANLFLLSLFQGHLENHTSSIDNSRFILIMHKLNLCSHGLICVSVIRSS